MITWVILTGGDSTRMGQDKASIRMEGASLLERAIAAAGEYRIVGAEVRGGPAHAVVTVAHELSVDAFGVLAVDMPFTARVVTHLADAWPTCLADALIARDARPQWLCGIYRRAAILDVAKDFPDTVGLPMWRITERLQVEYLPVTDTVSLFDMDTPADVEWAARRLREERGGERDRTHG